MSKHQDPGSRDKTSSSLYCGGMFITFIHRWCLRQTNSLNQGWMELGGLGWDHTSPIRAKSAKPSLHCPPTQRDCVWPWRWKLLTCQHLYKRTAPLRIMITLLVCDFILIQPITNREFGSLVVQIFLETELSWKQKYCHLFKPQWVQTVIYNMLYEPQSWRQTCMYSATGKIEISFVESYAEWESDHGIRDMFSYYPYELLVAAGWEEHWKGHRFGWRNVI